MRIVLVHGTTQSPDGWALVDRVLSAAGHEVHAIDLAGADPEGSAAQFAQLVAAQVPGGRADVVAAHSGSGLLLPSIASALHTTAQVYVAALVPDAARSFRDELIADPDNVVHPAWVGVDPTVDIDAARHFLFHDCDAAVGAWAETTLRRFMPTAVYDEVIAPVEAPAMVIVPTEDRTLLPSWMIDAARHRIGVEPVMLAAGHCPHVSRPEHVARLVIAAAATT